MRDNYFRITIIKASRPHSDNINDELQWFGGSLGLFNLRDKDKSCFRLFIELLKIAKAGKAMTSDELAHNTNLSRGTVVHHLNKLMQAGIVIHQANHYTLRSGNLSRLVDQVEEELEQMISEMRSVAQEIDNKMQSDQFPSRLFR